MKPTIKDFSKYLFWDTKYNKVDLNKHSSYIVSRVLEYGTLDDWKYIKDYYGLETIVEIARKLRTLDKKALAFISALANIPKENFRCYTIRQSMPQHCNF